MNPEPLKRLKKSSSHRKKQLLLLVITVLSVVGIATGVVILLQLVQPPAKTITISNPTDLPAIGIRADVDERNEIPKGQPAQFGHFEVKINKIVRNYKPADNRATTQNNYEYLLVDLSAKNTSPDIHALSDIELGLLSGEDVINSSLVRVEPVFKTGSINPGQSVSGNLVFEVPKGKNLKLYYNTQIYNYEKQKLEKIEYTLAF